MTWTCECSNKNFGELCAGCGNPRAFTVYRAPLLAKLEEYRRAVKNLEDRLHSYQLQCMTLSEQLEQHRAYPKSLEPLKELAYNDYSKP